MDRPTDGRMDGAQIIIPTNKFFFSGGIIYAIKTSGQFCEHDCNIKNILGNQTYQCFQLSL